jgi:hypothetical protein
MKTKVELALETTLTNWSSMSRSGESEAEWTANDFEHSFYLFVDAVREWVDGLEVRPRTLEELLKLPLIQEILERLPAPLLLNFETEADLIVENRSRVDEDKYD